MIFLILNFGTKFGNYLWRHNVNQNCETSTKKWRICQAIILPSFMPFAKLFISLWPIWKEKLTIVIRRRCVFVVIFKWPEKINVKRHWLQLMWNRANRLKSGGTPLGESTFGRKDRNSYIRTHAIGASKDSSPVILTSFLVNSCLRVRGDGCIYCCTPGIHWADW